MKCGFVRNIVITWVETGDYLEHANFLFTHGQRKNKDVITLEMFKDIQFHFGRTVPVRSGKQWVVFKKYLLETYSIIHKFQ